MSEIILQFCIKREKKFRENEMDLISLLEKSLFNMTLHREMCPATESYQCCTGNVLSYHFTCTWKWLQLPFHLYMKVVTATISLVHESGNSYHFTCTWKWLQLPFHLYRLVVTATISLVQVSGYSYHITCTGKWLQLPFHLYRKVVTATISLVHESGYSYHITCTG